MKYIDIHTHRKKDNKNIFSLQNISPEEFIQPAGYEKNSFSAGIHPWYIDTTVKDKINTLKQIASNPAVLAIGETGLDRICKTDFDLQKEVFNAQISIAKTVKKPLIIHCVRAYNDVLQLLKKAQTDIPVLFHGFRGKPLLAKELINAGFYLSFGGLFNEESLKQTPLERIFLETDDTNGEIEKTYTLAAKTRGIPVEELVGIVNENFERCFGKHYLSKISLYY